ncbi:methylated-DNA--[protein]-cysteine S-methyltransferase [Rickettsia hoogstraalii]|uniref:methylated-DNA--[protein]-cysteine S-methyltransferase n=1 Tax=Rickettsia hoogstraalii TaxID=467174 RepID=UPI00058CAEBF|nr:methylated-DNA--[protein]-cysteine S-methyltransferase [Rickettsia hoogstraalii]
MSLKSAWLDTPLGSMLVISDEERLYLLDFAESKGLEHKIKRLKAKTKSAITEDRTKPILSIEEELKLYFNGTLQKFNTPIYLLGSPFQKMVWQELINIPYGKTRSYLNQAKALGKPTSYRAVANANGMNQLATIVPCHRIINSNGELGGYGGGLHRKKWLIEHERKFTTN